jgi:protein ImuB
VAEPIVPVVPFEQPHAERRLLEPIGTAEAIAQVIGDLVDDLVAQLQERRLGCAPPCSPASSSMAASSGGHRHGAGQPGCQAPQADAHHAGRPHRSRSRHRSDDLSAQRVEDLQPEAMRADLGTGDRAADLAPLVDQLTGRIDSQGLFRVGLKESDVPERATRRLEPLATPTGWPAGSAPPGCSPGPNRSTAWWPCCPTARRAASSGEELLTA